MTILYITGAGVSAASGIPTFNNIFKAQVNQQHLMCS